MTDRSRQPSDGGGLPAARARRRWTVDREEGDEPDYRFTLANERTFLAWIRTSLGLLAGGVAVRQLAEPFGVTGSRRLLAVLSISSSMVFAVGAYLRWVTVQSAVRRGEPLPPARLVPVAASAVVSIALAAVILILL